jgi:hypothetical protein
MIFVFFGFALSILWPATRNGGRLSIIICGLVGSTYGLLALITKASVDTVSMSYMSGTGAIAGMFYIIFARRLSNERLMVPLTKNNDDAFKNDQQLVLEI